jgi:hypothetical protein
MYEGAPGSLVWTSVPSFSLKLVGCFDFLLYDSKDRRVAAYMYLINVRE